MVLVDFAHQHQVDGAGVFALGEVSEEISPLQIAYAVDDSVDNVVDTAVLLTIDFISGKREWSVFAMKKLCRPNFSVLSSLVFLS